MWYLHREPWLPSHFFDIFKSKWLHRKLASSLFIPPPQSSIPILDIILFKNVLCCITVFYRLYNIRFTIVFHLEFSYMFRRAIVSPHSANISKGHKKVKTFIWPFSHLLDLSSVHFLAFMAWEGRHGPYLWMFIRMFSHQTAFDISWSHSPDVRRLSVSPQQVQIKVSYTEEFCFLWRQTHMRSWKLALELYFPFKKHW